MNPQINLTNITSKGKLDVQHINSSLNQNCLDLKKICYNACAAVFDPSKNNALKLQFISCNTFALLYTSGAFTILGAKNFETTKRSVVKLKKLIRRCGYYCELIDVNITSISATVDYSSKVYRLRNNYNISQEKYYLVN